MKNLLLVFVLLLPFITIAQNTQIYEVHEVDSVAIPRGGYAYLTTFINANLQIPYMAKVAKVNGYVSLAGVVDEQGKISQVEVIKGIRPDCDKEAVRVFGLFNAWQAALKGGNKVKQKIFLRIPFKSMEDIVFVDGMQLQYFDSGYTPITDNNKAQYVQKIVIDTLTGFAKDNIDFFEIKNNKKEKLVASFLYKKRIVSNYVLEYPDELNDSLLHRYTTEYTTENQDKVRDMMIFLEDGTLQYKRPYNISGRPDYPLTTYYKNGMVRELSTYVDTERKVRQTTKWHLNGQIASITSQEEKTIIGTKNTMPSNLTIQNIINQWNYDGSQLVKNGVGRAIFKSYGSEHGIFTESGDVVNFQKDGLWQQKSEDGRIFYREIYKDGQLENGVAYWSKTDSSTYSGQSEQKAEYNGGMAGFGKFLQGNLAYPMDAQRSNAQGKAYIQFIVCTDGTLCDFEVMKSAGHPSLDQEAVRVLKKSSGQWSAGVQRGKKVRSRFTIPINFTLSR